MLWPEKPVGWSFPSKAIYVAAHRLIAIEIVIPRHSPDLEPVTCGPLRPLYSSMTLRTVRRECEQRISVNEVVTDQSTRNEEVIIYYLVQSSKLAMLSRRND